jgi:hypothetical protein
MSKPTRYPIRRLALAVATLGLLVSVMVWAAGKGKPVDAGAAPTAAAPTAAAKPETVRITLHTVPARKAQVKWGAKLLGVIPAPRPLIIERPRDSGPLDLVIRASGYLPVHTRAYTFNDSRVAVRLTPTHEKSRLFGYREEPVAPPDGGTPAEPGLPTTVAPPP